MKKKKVKSSNLIAQKNEIEELKAKLSEVTIKLNIVESLNVTLKDKIAKLETQNLRARKKLRSLEDGLEQ